MAKLGIQKRGHGIARIMGNTVPPQMKQSSMMGPDSMASSPMGSIPGMKKGGSTNWIQGAIKKPGSLKKSLGVKAGQKIPAAKLAAAAKKPGKMGKRARLAQTLQGLK